MPDVTARLAELDAMDARDLDLAIALKQGWTRRTPPGGLVPMMYPPGDTTGGMGQIVPLYTSDIEASMALLRDLVQTYLQVTTHHVHGEPGNVHHFVAVSEAAVRSDGDTGFARAIATLWLLHAEGLVE